LLRRAPLTIDRILAWAEAHWERTGNWPNVNSGRVHLAPFETWHGLNKALREGYRGLPGGSSLAKVLPKHKHQGKRNRRFGPPLTIEVILAWADAHRERTGQWPNMRSGRVYEVPWQTWNALNHDLMMGYRGLPGGSSLARLLVEHRGVRSQCALPPLTIPQILAWADAFHQRTRKWPQVRSGVIEGSSGETWERIQRALYEGDRGLPGGSSLARLLAQERGVRNRAPLPPLTIKQILRWAEAHHRRKGKWPSVTSGRVRGTGETWIGVNNALRDGWRGLPGGSSLARLLAEHRGSCRT